MDLQKYLQKKKITPSKFSDFSGLSSPTVHNIINGKRKFFNAETILRIVLATDGKVDLANIVGKEKYNKLKSEISRRLKI